MPLLEVVTLPNPVLRQHAHKLKEVTSETKRFIDDMIETMRDEPGVGLAAPQVGVSQRVIVVEYAEGSEYEDAPPKQPKLYSVVNPEITRHSRETVLGNEGCLSIPGYIGEVERYTAVTVKGLNRQGKPIKIKAKDWLARIFQHEIDHLDGVLYIDRATQVWRLEEIEETNELRAL